MMFVVDLATKMAIIKLGNCCSVQNGYPFKSEFYNEQTGIPLIRVRSLKEQNCDIYYNGPFDESFLVNDGDILIGMDGDFQPCYWQGGKALLNQRVCRLINFIDGVNHYYIYQALRKPLKDIENATYFTTVKHLSSFTIQEIQIPLPPFPEQRAIAHTLQTVQQTIHTRRQELELERERKAALIQHLFTHGICGEQMKQSEIGKIPESWEIRRLQDISEIAYGLTVNADRRQSTLQMVPYLAVNNVTRGYLRLNDVKQIGMLESDSKRYRLQKGDVLLVEGNGNPALLGSSAVWNDELPFALHQNHLIRARPKLNFVLPDWLMNYINSDNGRTQLLGKAKTSSGLSSINSRIVSNLLIPLPSLHDQTSIIEVISACNFKINVLEKEITLHEELFRALLDELMTGRISTLPLVEHLEKWSSHDGSRMGDGTETAH